MHYELTRDERRDASENERHNKQDGRGDRESVAERNDFVQRATHGDGVGAMKARCPPWRPSQGRAPEAYRKTQNAHDVQDSPRSGKTVKLADPESRTERTDNSRSRKQPFGEVIEDSKALCRTEKTS